MAIRTYDELNEQARHWQPDSARMPNGNTVKWAFWEVAQPRGFVFINPGRNERYRKYTEVASEWADRGIASLCLSPEPDIQNFQNYLDEFGHVFKNVWLPLVKDDFAIVQGHSTGAHTAARSLATGYRHIKGAEGLIMSAPLAGINYRQKFIPDCVSATVTDFMGKWSPDKYALGQEPFNRTSSKWQFEGNRWTSDPDRFAWMMEMAQREPDSAPNGAKWGWILAAQRSCNLLDRAIDKLELPQLLLHTPDDRAVSGPAQLKFARASRVDFPDSQHEIFMERDVIRNAAWKAVDDFVFRLRQNRSPSL